MRKLIDFISWFFVVVTVVVLIFTMLTTYQFIFLNYFNSYKLVELSTFFTMMIWAFKLLKQKQNLNKIYSLMCILIAICSILFMYIGVY